MCDEVLLRDSWGFFIHKAPCAAEVRAILFMVGLHKGNFFSKIFRRIEHGCNRYETDLNLGIVSVGIKIGEGEFFHTFLLFFCTKSLKEASGPHAEKKKGSWESTDLSESTDPKVST